MVDQLLAAGAAADAKDKVRGELGADRGGLGDRTQLCASSFFLFFCFSNSGFQLASRIRKGIGHLLRCKPGNVTDSPANHLKEFFGSRLQV